MLRFVISRETIDRYNWRNAVCFYVFNLLDQVCRAGNYIVRVFFEQILNINGCLRKKFCIVETRKAEGIERGKKGFQLTIKVPLH